MMGKIILIGGALVIISTFSFADVGQANALEQLTPLNKCKINGEWVLQKEPCNDPQTNFEVYKRESGTLGVDHSKPDLSGQNDKVVPLNSSVIDRSISQEKCVGFGQRTGFANKCKEVNKIYGKSDGYDDAGRDLDYSSGYYQFGQPRTQRVSGYTRSDGTYVRPYLRRR